MTTKTVRKKGGQHTITKKEEDDEGQREKGECDSQEREISRKFTSHQSPKVGTKRYYTQRSRHFPSTTTTTIFILYHVSETFCHTGKDFFQFCISMVNWVVKMKVHIWVLLKNFMYNCVFEHMSISIVVLNIVGFSPLFTGSCLLPICFTLHMCVTL